MRADPQEQAFTASTVASVRPSIRTLVAGLIILSACGANGADVNEDSFAQECEGRADFWIAIQQEYLNRLGDAAASAFDQPTESVAAAGEWVGTALHEFVGEADSVGCAAEVRSGSPLICSRLNRLEPAGEAGDLVLDQLLARCEPSDALVSPLRDAG